MAEKVENPEKAETASKEELESQFMAPAILANKSYVTLNPSGLILTFSENISPDVKPQPRARVILPYQDAIAFAALLQRMVEPLKEALAKASPVEIEKAKDG